MSRLTRDRCGLKAPALCKRVPLQWNIREVLFYILWHELGGQRGSSSNQVETSVFGKY